MYKFFLVLCIVASMGLLIGCDNTKDTVAVETTNEDMISNDNGKKNDVFNEISQETIKINLWVNDRLYEISDESKIVELFNYLSGLTLETEEYVLKEGGRIVELVTSNNKIALVLFEKDFLFDGTFYKISDEDIDVTSEVTDILQSN